MRYEQGQDIREQERALLARELHDQLGQALVAAKIDLAWIERRLPKELRHVAERVARLIHTLDDGINTIQNISSALRYPAPHPGLSAAMRELAKSFEHSTEIRCDIVSRPGEIVLDPELCDQILRIFRETLANSARHSAAKRVTARASKTMDRFLLEVSDDGKGIMKHEIANPRSLGLIGMFERADAIGGKLTITGIPGKGTTVSLTVPLRQPDATFRTDLSPKDRDGRTVYAPSYHR